MVVRKVVTTPGVAEGGVGVFDSVGIVHLLPVHRGRGTKGGNLKLQRASSVGAGLGDRLVLNWIGSRNRLFYKIKELDLEHAMIRAIGRGIDVLHIARNELSASAAIAAQVATVLLGRILCLCRVCVQSGTQISHLIQLRPVETGHHLSEVGATSRRLIHAWLYTLKIV